MLLYKSQLKIGSRKVAPIGIKTNANSPEFIDYRIKYRAEK